MGGFTPLSLPYQKQPTVLTEAAVEANVKPSAAWMDSRRVSDEINHYLSTMAPLEGRALCASKTLYNVDAVAKARGWVYAVTALPLPYQQQPAVLTEAPVEAHVKPSAAWKLLRRLHGWIHAVFLVGASPSHLGGSLRWYALEGRALWASETLYSMDAVAKAPWMGLRRVYEARKALPHQVQQIPRTKKALK